MDERVALRVSLVVISILLLLSTGLRSDDFKVSDHGILLPIHPYTARSSLEAQASFFSLECSESFAETDARLKMKINFMADVVLDVSVFGRLAIKRSNADYQFTARPLFLL
jgi:hypothetical protein